MSLRRQAAALVLGTALVASPAVSAAAPGAQPDRAELPPAAYNAELPPATDRGAREPATADGQRRTPVRVPQATVSVTNISRYVDGCEGTPDGTFDVRRLAVGVSTDGTGAVFTVRLCTDSTPLHEWTDQQLVLQTRPTQGGQAHVFTVEDGPSGGLVVRRDDEGSPVHESDVGFRDPDPAPGVTELLVVVPLDALDLAPSCSPSTSVACMTVGITSLDVEGVEHDQMPDADVPAPDWPSGCTPDADPAAVGHVQLTTTSMRSAQDVTTALHGAGYRADTHPDEPLVEVPVGASPAVVDVLRSWDEVVEVTPVARRRLSQVTPTDDQYGAQWYLRQIGLPDAWEATTGSSDVGIAIVDNGVDANRTDLAGRVGRGWDSLPEFEGSPPGRRLDPGVDSDLGGHGTAVAGLAAGSANDGGIVGVDWKASIHPVRVFDHAGCFVSTSNYLRSLDWVATEVARGRIHVVNFSLGGPPISGEEQRIAKIVAGGATVVAAMGNQGDVTGALASHPAALPEVIAVGATGPDDRRATYSNQGRHLDLVAPGGDQSGSPSGEMLTLADATVVGTEDPYTLMSGTSFSSPLVAGVAALYRAEYPDATPADTARALVTTATDLGSGLAGYDTEFGFGLVDARRVLAHRPGQTAQRLAGGDRYETAARIARHAFPDPDLVDVVLLATGEKYPDALAGGPLAAREHAPLLLTRPDRLPDATADALEYLDPKRVLLLGGETVLHPSLESQLAAYDVERAAGGDRYATAARIATGGTGTGWRSWTTSDLVFLATGENFPDALPGGAAAAAADAPLLLTSRTALPPATVEALEALGPSVVVVLGGPNAIGVEVTEQLDRLGIRAQRAQGGDRYATAAVTAQCPFSPCDSGARFVVVATGEGFADALGGSAAAAALRAPLLLVPRSGDVPGDVVTAMEDLAPEQALILGGTVPISDQMADDVGDLVVR